jgi:hypothetical protein
LKAVDFSQKLLAELVYKEEFLEHKHHLYLNNEHHWWQRGEYQTFLITQ